MKLRLNQEKGGIAMIIVMVVIFALGMLAAGFSYSMRVETRLAQQANYDADFEWLGRSGVELARCVLVEQFKSRSAMGTAVDALNQKWAGGTGGGTNILPEISLEHFEFGNATLSIKIVDAERKFNINRAAPATLLPEILNRAMIYMGVDASEASIIVDSIQDWIDRDDDERISGTESNFYLQQDPPYAAKNGPIDDLTELLLVRGIRENPAIFWGSRSANINPNTFMNRGVGFRREIIEYPVGLNDLFTTISMGRVNVNTASGDVLQMILGDTNAVSIILQRRQGPDGQDGTEDDMPFNSVAEVNGMLTGMVNPELVNQVFGVNSFVFEVTVTCDIGGMKREYVALIYRMNQRDANVLNMYWKRPGPTAAADSLL